MTTSRSQQTGLALVCSLTLMALVLCACGEHDDLSSPAAFSGLADKTDPEPTDPIPLDQEYLHEMWIGSNHDDWDIITGVINPESGGRIVGVPQSWPADYEFVLFIPGGAIDGTEPVEISIHVPSYVPGDEHVPVYKLEPHGLIFNEPVLVQFCYPPWLNSYPGYRKYCFWREEGVVEPVYFFSDEEWLTPSPDDARLGIRFRTLHFSRWGLDNGTGGHDGMPDES